MSDKKRSSSPLTTSLSSLSGNKIGNYILGETLGKGTFGKVKLGEHQFIKHKVAVKIINRLKLKTKDSDGATKIRREILNMKLFRHPHIIKLYQVISSPTDIFMIMEFVSGGELFEYIVQQGKLRQDEARRFFQQIISGLDYCHRHMIVHRDLKPENLLLDQNKNIKIADFGLSNMITDGDFMQTACGSPNYAAPEIISGKLYAGPEVDIWSAGVVLYAILCGSLPFDDENTKNLYRKIKSGIFALPDYLDKGAVHIIVHMLQVDPMKRATIAELKEYSWFARDLPYYLFPDPDDNDSTALDLEAVKEVCDKFEVEENEVCQSVLSGEAHDQLQIAYHLVVDNKRIADEAAKLDVNDFFVAASPPITPSIHHKELFHNPRGGVHDGSPCAPRPHPERMAPTRDMTPTLEPLLVPDFGRNHSAGDNRVVGLRPDLPKKVFKRPKWHLGIRSISPPNEIMLEVFRAMKCLNYEWKIVTPFQVRVRGRRDANDVARGFMRLSLQLYQVDPKSYLVDFKSLQDYEETPSAKQIDVTYKDQNDFEGRLSSSEGQLNSPSSTTGRFSIAKVASPLTGLTTEILPSLHDPSSGLPFSTVAVGSPSAAEATPTVVPHHHTMEFFEMCSSIILALAR